MRGGGVASRFVVTTWRKTSSPRSIGGLDGIGTESAHDQSTISVGGSGRAVGIHSDGLFLLILPHCVCGFLQANLHLELRELKRSRDENSGA